MSIVFINPGTGPVAGARLREAWKNARAFRCELTAATGKRYGLERLPLLDQGGRYGFKLMTGSKKWRVEMPGCPLPDVVGDWEGLPIPPRLYVDGSSWSWRRAVGVIVDR